jgi:hypothetical protein
MLSSTAAPRRSRRFKLKIATSSGSPLEVSKVEGVETDHQPAAVSHRGAAHSLKPSSGLRRGPRFSRHRRRAAETIQLLPPRVQTCGGRLGGRTDASTRPETHSRCLVDSQRRASKNHPNSARSRVDQDHFGPVRASHAGSRRGGRGSIGGTREALRKHSNPGDRIGDRLETDGNPWLIRVSSRGR